MFVVMGITGQAGGVTARELMARGHHVRGVVRDLKKAANWQEQGVELAVADYNDPDALESAFCGTEGVFVMIPPLFAPAPGFPETRRTISALRAALTGARPDKAVYLSSIGADLAEGAGGIGRLHVLEQELSEVPVPNAFLRAGWFIENLRRDIQSAKEEGKLFSLLQPSGHKFPMVSVQDVGSTAADVLTETWIGNRFIEVEGPDRYSFGEVAETFGKLLGHPVRAVDVPRDQWHDIFVRQGMPSDRTSIRIEMTDGFNSGRINFGRVGTESRKGHVTVHQALAALLSAK